MKKIYFVFICIALTFTANAKNYVASKNCINHIKKYEKCSLTSYPDAGGYSIGWGHHTSSVKANQKITQKQADAYLVSDVKEAEMYANMLIKSLPYKYKFSQGFFDGLVSLVYNCGYSGVKNTKFYTSCTESVVMKMNGA